MKLVTIDLDQKISWQEYDPGYEDYNDVGGSLEDFLSFADGIKWNPAVPLDKLCEWLARNAYAFECKDCEEYCKAMIECENEVVGDPEYWKNKLTKWMEEENHAEK